MKRIAIMLIGVFMLILIPVIPAQAFEANVGTVKRENGVFDSLKFNIQPTAKGTGIRYRTEEITVRFGGKSVTFTHADLEAHNFYNSSTSNVMSFTVADFAAKGISAEELQSHAQTSNFAIEPTIIVTNNGTPIAGLRGQNSTTGRKTLSCNTWGKPCSTEVWIGSIGETKLIGSCYKPGSGNKPLIQCNHG